MVELRSKGRVSPERLYWNYVIATAVGAVMIVTGYSISVLAARQGVFDEEAINVSGMQRMLSQRSMLLARRLSSTDNDFYYHLLNDTIDLFENNHQWLLDRLEEGTPLWDHYHSDGGAALDRGSRNLVMQMRQIVAQYEATGILPLERLQALEDVAIVDLLADLNHSVGLFESSANQRTALVRQLELVAAALVIAIMLFKAFLIFRPAHMQLTKTISRLRLQADVDPLTGLANRRHFMARSGEILHQAAPDYGTIFLLALDLDGFKEINDNLGHPAGDVVLRTVTSHLNKLALESSNVGDRVIARPGGDEFLILGVALGAPADEVAQEFSDAIITAIERPILVPIEGATSRACTVGVSIGIATAETSEGNVDQLVANGDIALYASKRSGKGIATHFTSKMREESERRSKWATEIKRGLDQLEFTAFFQPQIEIMTGQVIGMEALARWRHPELGLLSPAQFVDQIDEAHRTDALDGQIILQAVEMLHQCRDAGFQIERMSINASGALLRDPGFAGMLSDLVTAYGLKPEDFTVEVLENIVIHSGEDDAVTSVRRLKSAGFSVAIDEFGSGYSSFESVAMLDCDVIKIDQSLIRRLDDPRFAKIVVASVAMAQGLGTRVYAEGLATLAHLDFLDGLGVDVCQGQLASEPLAPSDLLAWLARLDRSGSTNIPIWRSTIGSVDDAA